VTKAKQPCGETSTSGAVCARPKDHHDREFGKRLHWGPSAESVDAWVRWIEAKP
jgi:hypothetical protein